jgi:hypothetical protein
LEKYLKNAGWTGADMRFMAEFGEASLSEDEFEAFVQDCLEAKKCAEKNQAAGKSCAGYSGGEFAASLAAHLRMKPKPRSIETWF